MAEQMLLVRTYDFEADQDSVSLLNRTDGFEPAYGGWVPNVTPNKKGVVSEAITLRVQGTSTDHIATNLQKLADKARQVQEFTANQPQRYAVWFRVQSYGESKGRQTLVHDLRHEPASAVFDVALRSSFHWNQYTLGMDRDPWWEGTALGTVTAGTISCRGGTFAFGTINGDLPPRIARVRVAETAASGGGTLFPFGRVWAGIRSSYYGTPSAFVSHWPLGVTASGVGYFPGTAAALPDADDPSGTAIVFAPTTNSEFFVYGLQVAGVAGTITNWPNQVGDFLFLLRARTNGTAEFLARISSGNAQIGEYVGGATPGYLRFKDTRYNPRFSIVHSAEQVYGTAYHFYEAGIVNIRPSLNAGSAVIGSFGVFLYAQRISGTANLYIDGFYLIPTEGMVYASYPNKTYWADPNISSALLATNGPDGVVSGNAVAIEAYPGYTDGYIYSPLQTQFETGPHPGGTASVVVCAESNEKSYLNCAVNVTINYAERWQSWRGND